MFITLQDGAMLKLGLMNAMINLVTVFAVLIKLLQKQRNARNVRNSKERFLILRNAFL